MAPKAYRYASKRSDNGEVRKCLRVLASERRRFGYRRLHILLTRPGMRLNASSTTSLTSDEPGRD
jgi:putative transposase